MRAGGPRLFTRDIVHLAGAEIGVRQQTVRHADGVHRFTPTEWQLLVFLLGRPDVVHSRAELAAGAWGEGYAERTSEVEVYVSRLRRKLGPAGGQLETVRGRGYRLRLDGTTDDEVRERSRDFDRLHGFIEAVLTRLSVAVAVVDTDMKLQIWNSCAEDLWGLCAREVIGRSLVSLDIGLPRDDLALALRRCLDGESDAEESVITAVDRHGGAISCRVTCSPLLDRGVIEGAVVLMEVVAALRAAGGC